MMRDELIEYSKTLDDNYTVLAVYWNKAERGLLNVIRDIAPHIHIRALKQRSGLLALTPHVLLIPQTSDIPMHLVERCRVHNTTIIRYFS